MLQPLRHSVKHSATPKETPSRYFPYFFCVYIRADAFSTVLRGQSNVSDGWERSKWLDDEVREEGLVGHVEFKKEEN